MFRVSRTLCPKTLTVFILAMLLGVVITAYAVQATEPHPEIVVNEQDDTITFVIEGRPIVIVNSDGLHVNGNLSYTDTIRDAGVLPKGQDGGRDHAQ